MPKKAEYSIRWSSQEKCYEIIHSTFSSLLSHRSSMLWQWLDCSDTFHFCSRTAGSFTLRKETKQRGSGYWYGYKRVNGRVEKKYIGEKNKVTFERLEEVAQHFAGLASSTSKPPPVSPPPRPEPPPAAKPPPQPKKPVLPKFTNSLASALLIYGFASVPPRNVLITRYRELSKQYHPDVGGLHEDMVMVNQAYDYLKKFL